MSPPKNAVPIATQDHLNTSQTLLPLRHRTYRSDSKACNHICRGSPLTTGSVTKCVREKGSCNQLDEASSPCCYKQTCFHSPAMVLISLVFIRSWVVEFFCGLILPIHSLHQCHAHRTATLQQRQRHTSEI